MGADGKMVENNTPEVDSTRRIVNESTAPKVPSRECPKDHEARTLTMRDRNYIIGAVENRLSGNPKKDGRNQNRISLLKTLLRFDETREFFAVVKDDLDERRVEWLGKRNLYWTWRKLSEGALSEEEVRAAKESFPSLDVTETYERPSPVMPEYTEEEKRGPEETFFIPKKLDVWIKEALEKMEWRLDMNEGSVEILGKYGILKEEDV